MMEMVNLLVVIAAAGVLLWLVNTYIPMPDMVYTLLNVAVFTAFIIYLLQYFSIIPTVIPVITIFK